MNYKYVNSKKAPAASTGALSIFKTCINQMVLRERSQSRLNFPNRFSIRIEGCVDGPHRFLQHGCGEALVVLRLNAYLREFRDDFNLLFIGRSCIG